MNPRAVSYSKTLRVVGDGRTGLVRVLHERGNPVGASQNGYDQIDHVAGQVVEDAALELGERSPVFVWDAGRDVRSYRKHVSENP